MSRNAHIWVALSPHGFGHAAMTAPVVRRLQERLDNVRVTVQTTVDSDFLNTRYHNCTFVREIADFGFSMLSATKVDLSASAAGYADLNDKYENLVKRNCDLLLSDPPDFVLSNVAFIPLAAAQRCAIPCAAMSSINWADMYRHYLGNEGRILERMLASYQNADAFLRCTPSQRMTLNNMMPIGPIAAAGVKQRAALAAALAVEEGMKIGLAAFGGIDHDVDVMQWPKLPQWRWITTQKERADREDIRFWGNLGLSFADIAASVDVVITKPGYGTFTEAAMSGVPVLFSLRPDWPESPHLDNWLANHTRSLGVPAEELAGLNLENQLHTLFLLPKQHVALPTGIDQAVDYILSRLEATPKNCGRS